jgi:hypothetical protein
VTFKDLQKLVQSSRQAEPEQQTQLLQRLRDMMRLLAIEKPVVKVAIEESNEQES